IAPAALPRYGARWAVPRYGAQAHLLGTNGVGRWTWVGTQRRPTVRPECRRQAVYRGSVKADGFSRILSGLCGCHANSSEAAIIPSTSELKFFGRSIRRVDVLNGHCDRVGEGGFRLSPER